MTRISLTMLLILAAASTAHAQALCSACQQRQSSVNQWQRELSTKRTELSSRKVYSNHLAYVKADLWDQLDKHNDTPFVERDRAWYDEKDRLWDAYRDCQRAIADNQTAINILQIDIGNLEEIISWAKQEMKDCAICNPD